jgi:hypothetical protein
MPAAGPWRVRPPARALKLAGAHAGRLIEFGNGRHDTQERRAVEPIHLLQPVAAASLLHMTTAAAPSAGSQPCGTRSCARPSNAICPDRCRGRSVIGKRESHARRRLERSRLLRHWCLRGLQAPECSGGLRVCGSRGSGTLGRQPGVHVKLLQSSSRGGCLPFTGRREPKERPCPRTGDTGENQTQTYKRQRRVPNVGVVYAVDAVGRGHDELDAQDQQA